MARIAGVDLPRNKRMEIALTYIYGIGRTSAKNICTKLNFDQSLRTDALNEVQLADLRALLEGEYKVEGDKRREVGLNLKRLMDLGCYRGIRHRRGLPCRGQSTRQNARTRKGPKKTVANKKKAI
ncbi:MAG: 30S ribosomal protein S13 [Bdellovibrionaceae bacterium]|jgi:small subunit ribosomal protein S13|nr:30S ribosomal protein S13 [Pseudobdellovibrionaceae bacterium]